MKVGDEASDAILHPSADWTSGLVDCKWNTFCKDLLEEKGHEKDQVESNHDQWGYQSCHVSSTRKRTIKQKCHLFERKSAKMDISFNAYLSSCILSLILKLMQDKIKKKSRFLFIERNGRGKLPWIMSVKYSLSLKLSIVHLSITFIENIRWFTLISNSVKFKKYDIEIFSLEKKLKRRLKKGGKRVSLGKKHRLKYFLHWAKKNQAYHPISQIYHIQDFALDLNQLLSYEIQITNEQYTYHTSRVFLVFSSSTLFPLSTPAPIASKRCFSSKKFHFIPLKEENGHNSLENVDFT